MLQRHVVWKPSLAALTVLGVLAIVGAATSTESGALTRAAPDSAATAPLIEALAACLSDEDPRIADSAADALTAIGEDAVAPVLAVLDSDSSKAKLIAATVLGRIGSSKALPGLARLLRKEETLETRLAALQAINQLLGDESQGSTYVPQAKRRQDISGEWGSNWGPVKIKCGPRNRDGRFPVTGSWVQGPQMFGEIVSGSFDPGSGRFRFQFDEPWHQRKGSAELQLSADGKTLSGTWRFNGGGGGGWTMTRK